MLTDKQEKFVQELIKGKSQREAYKIAYPTSLKWNENSIDNKASLLFKNAKVMQRYNELKNKVIKRAEKECLVSVEKIIGRLDEIAFNRETIDAQTTKSLELLGKHVGMFKNKVEGKLTFEETLKKVIGDEY